MNINESLQSLIESFAGFGPALTEKIIYSMATIFVILGLRFLATRFAMRKLQDNARIYKWQKIISATSNILLVFFVGKIWLEGIGSIATFLGLLSAGLAIALKDPVADLAGFGFILWRRPFELGDRVEVGPIKGDVIDINLFQFTLLEIGGWVHADQSTGRIIYVQNSSVFTQNVINYNKGFYYIWNEVAVLITFESNWRKAKEILQKIIQKEKFQLGRHAEQRIRESSRQFMIHYSHLTPTVYTTVKNSGVLLTIRYLCEPRKRRGSEQDIWESILELFENHVDIDFAYPTNRLFRHNEEGKEAVAEKKTS